MLVFMNDGKKECKLVKTIGTSSHVTIILQGTLAKAYMLIVYERLNTLNMTPIIAVTKLENLLKKVYFNISVIK